MEKIIFLSLAIPVLGFVFYLGVSAISKGFKAKNDKLSEETINEEDVNKESRIVNDSLSDEISKLNDLFQKGALTKEEFEKAKRNLLDKLK
ncbi:SHOCT domain-containing protein [Candidatus Pelagibacter bacterium]|jgi:hypothetical protein|nr:SHOCT domain-containing protein [Candidatus Pelagibacter bacterium]|tara:strand:- start:132 stop:404 length:273 start_codon:yes stop_codon:yes gene_type:complete